ncbi:MAG: DUF2141 domain-containing protein [Aestuariivita sp.]|nr:DUF2141 domain-containing protein [Aestuariivita sp.]
MKKVMTIIACCGFTLGFASVTISGTLTLVVSDTSEKGDVRAAVFSSQTDFENGDSSFALSRSATLSETKLEIEDLPPGNYGVAVFQDLNGNEQLDRNLFVVPTEPYGFSQNPVISFSAPHFDEFDFEFTGTPLELNIVLNGG